MKQLAPLALFATLSCALFAPTPQTPPAKAAPAKPRPAWVSEHAFALSSTVTAGVGVESVEASEPCWSSGVLLQAARNRALAELAKVFDAAPDSEAAIALLKGAEVKVGWFDGDHTVYMLATITKDPPPQLKTLAATGGDPIAKLEASLKDAARAHLASTGICNDPYKRLDIKCCGGPATFCSDPTRFSRQLPHEKCACNDGPPCHQDFKCEERQGQKKCICRGAKCPCEVRNCSAGQTCGDGRCY